MNFEFKRLMYLSVYEIYEDVSQYNNIKFNQKIYKDVSPYNNIKFNQIRCVHITRICLYI